MSDQICGIPSSKDIGGVEMKTVSSGGYFQGDSDFPWKSIVFKNYNSAPVTVFYDYYDARDGARTSSAIVLQSNETKATPKIVAPSDIKMIVIKNNVNSSDKYIGGVEVSKNATGGYYHGDPSSPWITYRFINYNNFSVSVSYSLFDGRSGKTNGSIVLEANSAKSTEMYVGPSQFSMQIRKLN